MKNARKIHVVGGGTFSHIRCHLALSAPAFGEVAGRIARHVHHHSKLFAPCELVMHLTRMANPDHTESHDLITNEDVARLAQSIADDPLTKVVFFSPALCDFEAKVINEAHHLSHLHPEDDYKPTESGRHEERLDSDNSYTVALTPAPKLLPIFRQKPNSSGIVRKDITLVAFKTTCGKSKAEMYIAGLKLLKKSSCNLVLVNDTKTLVNMIVTPEEATYHVTTDREEAIRNLVEMAGYRSQLTFTQSEVVAGDPVPWNDPRVPESLRTVVNHCIRGKAYKPFQRATVGHFACRLDETTFLTSIRKSNFNELDKTGLVLVKTSGPDTVLAYGAKPSVGGQSQRTVFRDHPGFDAIVHFHCPLRPDHPDNIPVVSQREVECGSHQCGRNTSNGLAQFGNLKAVMLDNHGPNIVFPASIDPLEVIDFIERNFDLAGKTGGYQLPMRMTRPGLTACDDAALTACAEEDPVLAAALANS